MPAWEKLRDWRLGLAKAFAFGLGGASLVLTTALVNDSRVKVIHMAMLIASMPMLLCAGVTAAGAQGGKNPGPYVWAISSFVLALGLNVSAIGGVLWDCNKSLGMAFWIGTGIGCFIMIAAIISRGKDSA